MPPRRGNSKTKTSDAGPPESSSQSGGESTDNQAVLAAKATLQAELSLAKSDICHKNRQENCRRDYHVEMGNSRFEIRK